MKQSDGISQSNHLFITLAVLSGRMLRSAPALRVTKVIYKRDTFKTNGNLTSRGWSGLDQYFSNSGTTKRWTGFS